MTDPERDAAKLAEAAIGVLEVADEEAPDLQLLPPAAMRQQIAEAAEAIGVTPEDAAQLAEAAVSENLARAWPRSSCPNSSATKRWPSRSRTPTSGDAT